MVTFGLMKAAETFIGHVLQLKEQEDDMRELITLICRSYSIPKEKRILALSKLSDAVQIITGNSDPGKIKHFDEKDETALVCLMQELGKGRQFIFLMKEEDGSGAVDLISKKQFKFKQ